MNPQTLLAFYFGSIDDDARLEIERALLTDEENLISYFDLKREIEAARAVPSGPSPNLWRRLANSKHIRRQTIVSISLGAALAAGLALFFVLRTGSDTQEIKAVPVDRVLFDSSAEQSASLGVL